MNRQPGLKNGACNEGIDPMARNYRELQAKMDPTSRAENKQRVREEVKRMALEELRGAKQLTQADLAEMLDLPQSSISRIEQRADMYLSTLRNYIHAVGGELRIQAVFPDGGTVVIDRFGEYEERPYVIDAVAVGVGVFRLRARPLHFQGAPLSTKDFKASGLTRALRALQVPEAQVAKIKASLERAGDTVEIGGSGGAVQRVFAVSELVGAGFEEGESE